MKIKIWDVEIGYNFMVKTVVAKDFRQAGDKAIDLSKEVPKDECYVSRVVLVREVEG